MLNKEAEYTTGSPELDDLIGPILPNSMLLIAGHPGSGKPPWLHRYVTLTRDSVKSAST